MTDKSQRFIVWLFAMLLVSTFIYKGHCSRMKTGSAVAFTSLSTGRITIRVTGDVSAPGIYRLPDGTTIRTVINMTMGAGADVSAPGIDFGMSLSPGMIIDFERKTLKTCEVSLGYMKAKERIVLGIPLDLRFMSGEDWQALPGIGPKTANEIISYRQKHGDFHSLEQLEMVNGLSEKKIENLRQFFANH